MHNAKAVAASAFAASFMRMFGDAAAAAVADAEPASAYPTYAAIGHNTCGIDESSRVDTILKYWTDGTNAMSHRLFWLDPPQYEYPPLGCTDAAPDNTWNWYLKPSDNKKT